MMACRLHGIEQCSGHIHGGGATYAGKNNRLGMNELNQIRKKFVANVSIVDRLA